MEINKQEFDTWMIALRSSKFEQGRGMLQTQNGFCCLGVACKVLVPDYETSGGMLMGALPLPYSGAPEWLVHIHDDFTDKTRKHLSSLNDKEGFTFDEIADLLEAVYIYKVLEER